MAESDGEFSIERVVTGESGREQEETPTARKPHERDTDEVQTTDAATLEAKARRDDAFPASLRRKYYVVAEEKRKESDARFYADERGEYLAFKLAEDRLTTRLTAPEVIRDMIAVAEHRDWATLHVRGSVEFRREAWLEANARGIAVKGYEPTALDREALASRRATRWRYGGRPMARPQGKRPSADRSRTSDQASNNVTAIDPAKRRSIYAKRRRITGAQGRRDFGVRIEGPPRGMWNLSAQCHSSSLSRKRSNAPFRTTATPAKELWTRPKSGSPTILNRVAPSTGRRFASDHPPMPTVTTPAVSAKMCERGCVSTNAEGYRPCDRFGGAII